MKFAIKGPISKSAITSAETNPTPSAEPPILKSLRLKNSEVQRICKKLMPGSGTSVTYTEGALKPFHMRFVTFDADKVFVFLDKVNVCDINDKAAYIKRGVEYGLKLTKQPKTFNDVAIGGVITGNGFFSAITGGRHAFAAFKLPRETSISIEDPKTDILSRTAKLQSRFDDQICCFAATALVYFSFKEFLSGNTIIGNTKQMFEEIHADRKVRGVMGRLEHAVGKVRLSKTDVMNAFADKLSTLTNPIRMVPKSVARASAGPDRAEERMVGDRRAGPDDDGPKPAF